MASKSQKAGNGRISAVPSTPAADTTPDAALSFSQDQMQAMIGLSDLLFKGAEEIRRCQMQAAHQAHEQHEKAQAMVAKAHTPAELFDVQSELLRFDMQSAANYWQQLASICAATNAEAMDLVTRSAATVGNDVAKLVALPLPQASTHPVLARVHASEAASPDAPTQAWNQWIDLGKQWTDMLYHSETAIH